jgi:hypothetical protein
MRAYAEAIAPETTDQRHCEIERQLREYCKLDTFAMVRIWKVFAGKLSGNAPSCETRSSPC